MSYPTYQGFNGGFAPRIEPNYMQHLQNQSYPQAAQPGFVCRPVTSREEAVAVQVDYLGPGTLMPDLGHGVVYFKRFNSNTGGADFLTFKLHEEPQAPAVEFALRQDIDALQASIDRLGAEVERLKKPATKGGKKDDE